MKSTVKSIKRELSQKGEKPVSERNIQQREKILKSAGKLFWQNGYLGTSVDEVAKAANLNKATIYYYFLDKDQILYEIVTKANQGLYDTALPIYNSDLSPENKLEQLIINQLKWSSRNQGLAGIGQVERKNLSPKRMKAFTQMRDEYEGLFRNVIEEIVSKNKPKIIEGKLATLFILGMMNSIRQWYKPGGDLTSDQIAAEASKFVFRAIGCKD